MAKQQYRTTWDDVAVFNADHMAGWGAFDGYHGRVDVDDDGGVGDVVVQHLVDTDILVMKYVFNNGIGRQAAVNSTVRLLRKPCRLGGARVFFRCPRCTRPVLRLALLPSGALCGQCGRITWASQRETAVQRMVRRADKLALRLGLDHFRQPPKRPARMRVKTYIAIIEELMPLRAEIERRAGERLAGAREPLLAMATLARWGL